MPKGIKKPKSIKKRDGEQTTYSTILSSEEEELSPLMGATTKKNSNELLTSGLVIPGLEDTLSTTPAVNLTANITATQSLQSDVMMQENRYNTTSCLIDDTLKSTVVKNLVVTPVPNLRVKGEVLNAETVDARYDYCRSNPESISTQQSLICSEKMQATEEETGTQSRLSKKHVRFSTPPKTKNTVATLATPVRPIKKARRRITATTLEVAQNSQESDVSANEKDEEAMTINQNEDSCWNEHFNTKAQIRGRLLNEIHQRQVGQAAILKRYEELTEHSYIGVTGKEYCLNCFRLVKDCPNLFSNECDRGYYPDDPMNGPIEEPITYLDLAYRDDEHGTLEEFDTSSVARIQPHYEVNQNAFMYSRDLQHIINTELYSLINSI